MGKYAKKDWYIKYSSKFIAEYGDVPPPWIYSPDSHPYSLEWRMGGGESHIMVLGEWLDQQNFDEAAKITYAKKYAPPPRWLEWVVHFIWLPHDDYDVDYAPYLEKLKMLGFEGTDRFEEDMNDDQWLNNG